VGRSCRIRSTSSQTHTIPDQDEIKEWLGDYDPGVFDAQPVRERLARIAARRSAPRKAKARFSADVPTMGLVDYIMMNPHW